MNLTKIKISIIATLAALFLSPALVKAQCNIKAYATPKTVCAGKQVFFSSNGQCNYLMKNDFNNQTLGIGWSSTAANPVFTNPCGAGPNSWHAWVGTTASQTRTLETVNYNVSIGNCKIEFWMRYGRVQGSGPCEDPDEPDEGVHLQYSINNGVTWADFPGPNLQPSGINSTTPPFSTTSPGSGGYWTPAQGQAAQTNNSLYYWHQYSCPIPAVASISNAKFRWAQLATSNQGWDAWGIDEVEIKCPDTNAVYTWTDPVGTVIGNIANMGYYTPTITGYYYITITDTVSGDSAVDSVYITVNPVPTADFTLSDSIICDGEEVTITYTGNADTSATYDWTIGGSTYTQQGPYVQNYTPPGVYPVSLHVMQKGCESDVETANIHVKENPALSMMPNPYAGCSPLEVSFTNHSTPANTAFVWEFGDGTTSSAVDPVHVFNTPGSYTITLSGITPFGCKDTFSIPNLINVHPNPSADFLADPTYVSFKDPTIQFTDLTTGATTWSWDFGDGGTDNTQNPSHTFNGDGEFWVTLIVASDKGCLDTVTKKVVVIVDEIKVPNIIAPNGDGKNDVFKIENIERLEFSKLVIYNRWGKKIYEDINYQNDWDGEGFADGVYYWVLEYKTYFEDRFDNGTVTILTK